MNHHQPKVKVDCSRLKVKIEQSNQQLREIGLHHSKLKIEINDLTNGVNMT